MITQYREVSRKANVGDRIKIVNAFTVTNAYANGDEMTVEARQDIVPCGVHTKEQPVFVYDNEYVVLEPVESAATLPEILTQFLRENAAAVRKYLDEIEPAPAVDSGVSVEKPLTRTTVIAKAKADVAELLRIGRNDRLYLPESAYWRGRWFEVDFVVNRDKRAVTALVYEIDGLHRTFRRINRKPDAKATAKAAPGDVFHAEIGKAIALRKALGLPVPDEYINAPKPDEPRAGAVALWTTSKYGPKRTTFTKRVPDCDGSHYGNYAFLHTAVGGWITDKQYVVIDDTDVDYENTAEVAA